MGWAGGRVDEGWSEDVRREVGKCGGCRPGAPQTYVGLLNHFLGLPTDHPPACGQGVVEGMQGPVTTPVTLL